MGKEAMYKIDRKITLFLRKRQKHGRLNGWYYL